MQVSADVAVPVADAVHRGLFAERRARERFGLRCPVLLIGNSAVEPVRATVLNISSKGMYWVSKASFTPLETVYCTAYITPEKFRPAAQDLVLECSVQVVRVEAVAAGFGVGVSITAYKLRRPENQT